MIDDAGHRTDLLLLVPAVEVDRLSQRNLAFVHEDKMKSELYEKDFYLWTREQAQLLRAGKISEVDIENLCEEVEAMGRAEKRALRSRLQQITSALLKLKLSAADYRLNDSKDEVIHGRIEVAHDLADTPSMKGFIFELFKQSWSGAAAEFNKDMRYFGESVRAPVECSFTLEQILDEDFWPIDDNADGRAEHTTLDQRKP